MGGDGFPVATLRVTTYARQGAPPRRRGLDRGDLGPAKAVPAECQENAARVADRGASEACPELFEAVESVVGISGLNTAHSDFAHNVCACQAELSGSRRHVAESPGGDDMQFETAARRTDDGTVVGRDAHGQRRNRHRLDHVRYGTGTRSDPLHADHFHARPHDRKKNRRAVLPSIVDTNNAVSEE